METEEAQRKLESQMALKRQHEQELEEFRATGDVELLKAWAQMCYKQPAPSAIQELKNKLGLSWRKIKTFIDTL